MPCVKFLSDIARTVNRTFCRRHCRPPSVNPSTHHPTRHLRTRTRTRIRTIDRSTTLLRHSKVVSIEFIACLSVNFGAANVDRIDQFEIRASALRRCL